jgi:hypothetical protein
MDELSQLALGILVWGPGFDSQSPARLKREEISEELFSCGHVPMMSELLSRSDSRLSANLQELAQAYAVDLILVLLDSPGAIAEAAEFATHPEIAGKIRVYAPNKHRAAGGLIAEGMLANLSKGYGAVIWYSPDDLRACRVMDDALMWVQARRNLWAAHYFLARRYHTDGGARSHE